MTCTNSWIQRNTGCPVPHTLCTNSMVQYLLLIFLLYMQNYFGLWEVFFCFQFIFPLWIRSIAFFSSFLARNNHAKYAQWNKRNETHALSQNNERQRAEKKIENNNRSLLAGGIHSMRAYVFLAINISFLFHDLYKLTHSQWFVDYF